MRPHPIVWQSGWRKTAAEARRVAEQEIAARPAWVVDGVSRLLLQAADTVVFLDVGRLVCLGRCLRRNMRYLFRSRPGLPERCPEILILPRLVQLIWRFPKVTRPWIMAALQEGTEGRTLVHLRSGEDLHAFLASVEAGNTSEP